MAFYNDLKLHLQAGVPAIYVESSEWEMFRRAARGVCAELRKSLYSWDELNFLVKLGAEPKNDESQAEPAKFADVLAWLAGEAPKGAVCVFESVQSYWQSEASDIPALIAAVTRTLSVQNKHIIMTSPIMKMPKILEKEFAVLDLPLPDRGDIRAQLKGIASKYRISDPDDANQILDAVRGLGATEIRNAFAKAAVQHKKITAEEIPFLIDEKEQIIRKSGHLTFVRTDEEMDSVGGLEKLKDWLRLRKHAFGEQARAAKLNAPKGVLLLGVPGTGKSLCAKAVAREWQKPLLRLDMGRIFSSGVGDSEANMRNAIKTAEGLAPCVLWIDEIEKGVSSGAGGELDGGTSARVFGSFLTWMQEKQKEVFVFATANNISRLPPEMLRKGRFDEIFFVDLPDTKARKEIFNIHLRRKNQDADASDELLGETEGFSGSEIEAVVNEALFHSYKPGQNPVVRADFLLAAAKEITPLSSTMEYTIDKLRQWAKHRCRTASGGESPKVPPAKGGVLLRTEADEWFATKKGEDK